MIYGYNLFVFAYIYFYLHKKALINAAWYVSKLKKKKILLKFLVKCFSLSLYSYFCQFPGKL